MKYIIAFIFVFTFTSCNQPDSNKSEKISALDTAHSNVSPKRRAIDTMYKPGFKENQIHSNTTDTLLMQVSTKILNYIKSRNYKKLASYIHPGDGLLFSPYAFIDKKKNQLLSPNQMIELAKQNRPINWGSSWEEADKPELMTIEQYIKRFVYDVDFLNAELKSINKFHSQGTDLNNINKVYPDCDVVEFFFSGFEKKYGGHDFRALRLVFKIQNNKLYLVAIVHDEWTP